MIDFLCQIEILVLKMLKLLKIPGFSRLFLPKLWNSRFFKVFFRFPGKVATLYITTRKIS